MLCLLCLPTSRDGGGQYLHLHVFLFWRKDYNVWGLPFEEKRWKRGGGGDSAHLPSLFASLSVCVMYGKGRRRKVLNGRQKESTEAMNRFWLRINQSTNLPGKLMWISEEFLPHHRIICGISCNDWSRILHGVNCLCFHSVRFMKTHIESTTLDGIITLLVSTRSSWFLMHNQKHDRENTIGD